jgi:hypothetical protein
MRSHIKAGRPGLGRVVVTGFSQALCPNSALRKGDELRRNLTSLSGTRGNHHAFDAIAIAPTLTSERALFLDAPFLLPFARLRKRALSTDLMGSHTCSA